MINARREEGWEGIEPTDYKNEPGTWMDVRRHVLFDSAHSQFQTRAFELAPEGYTSFEKHEHEHCVVVMLGGGRVRLGDAWTEIGSGDVVHVGPWEPHQFVAGSEGMTILCIVDRERDRPVLLGNSEPPEAS